MVIWGRLLGIDKAIDGAVDTVNKVTGVITSGIDAVFYTDEEKARAASKAVENGQKMVSAIHDQWMPRAISRRILAYMFSAVFLSILITAVVFACLSKIDVVNSIIAIVKAFDLGWIVLGLMGFYFGVYEWKKMLGK